MFNKGSGMGYPYLIPYLIGNAFNFSPLTMMLVVGLSHMTFIMLGYASPVTYFVESFFFNFLFFYWEINALHNCVDFCQASTTWVSHRTVFIINRYWILSEPFSALIEIIVLFLFFTLLICIILIFFQVLKHSYTFWTNPTWSWCVILIMYCQILTSNILRLFTSVSAIENDL